MFKKIVATAVIAMVLPFTFGTAPAEAHTVKRLVCSRPIGDNPPVCRIVKVRH